MPLFEQMYQISKKPVLVLPTSTPVIEASKEDFITLDQVSYIYYLIYFKKMRFKL